MKVDLILNLKVWNGLQLCSILVLLTFSGCAESIRSHDSAPLKEQKSKEEIEEGQKMKGREMVATGLGKSFKDFYTGMEFVYINGGCFQMGDTFGDGERDEKWPKASTTIY